MIGHRKVIFISGFDPRSPAVYHRMITREYRDFVRRAGAEGATGRLERHLPNRQSLRWTMATRWPEGETRTDFEMLGWRDLMSREFRLSGLERTARGLVTFAAMLRRGHFRHYLHLKLEGAAMALYPFAMLILYLVAMAAIVVGASVAAHAIEVPLPGFARAALGALMGVLGAALFYRFTRRIDQTLYVWYLVNDWISMRGLARDRDPELDARITAFANRMREAIASDCDEVVIVGHSSGSILASMALDEALATVAVDPDRRPRLSLLTLGSNFFSTGRFHPAARLKRALRALGRRADLDWADVFAPQDLMSTKVDPVTAYAGVPADDPDKVNPALVSARLARSLAPERYKKVRWRFFTLHFQFMVAPDNPGHYDFYRCIAGPKPFAEAVDPRVPPAKRWRHRQPARPAARHAAGRGSA